MKCILPEMPKSYWINKITYKCKKCGFEFVHLILNGYEIVKCKEENGIEIRWLPTYGKGGYLDLLCKLIPNHKSDDEITMKESNEFNAKFGNFVETSLNGNKFIIDNGSVQCIKCKSNELQLVSEHVLTSPELNWLKIDGNLLKETL